MDIKKQVIKILEDQLHVKVRYEGEHLSDMGADSLDLIELVNTIEDVFGVKIDNDQFNERNINLDMSVRDLVNMVKELKSE